MPIVSSNAARRLIRRLSIAFEFATARRWEKRHPDFKKHPTVGVMMPVDAKSNKTAS